MDRPAAAPPRQAAGIALRPDRLARLFLLVCVGIAIWLAIPPARDYLSVQSQATQTHGQLQRLQAQERRLQAQGRDLSRGTGLEEQARRQGLIEPSEKSYVIQDLPQP